MEIAMGPVFDDFGGVTQHIHGIKEYSSHNIKEIPSKFSRMFYTNTNLGKHMYKMYMNSVRLKNYNVVHSHVDPWFTKLCLSSRSSNCKWAHTFHTLYFQEDYPEGLNSWQKSINYHLLELAPKADIMISISRWLQDYLLENYSIYTELIPNGVDLDICDKANSDKFTEKYGITNFVLYAGNIGSIKNPLQFIELARNIPEITFVMIGKGLNSNNIKKTLNNPIPKNIIALGELIYEDSLNAISACDALVMTSKREGFPTVLLEAMSMNKPIIASNVHGCKEIVDNQNIGLLYDLFSTDDLVDKMHKLLISKNIGKNSRSIVEKKYDWKVLAKKIDLLYEL